ncbi:serine protease [Catenovulum sp. 2E275]|uniref:S1 family peptidase n=1 Tax=Catenovulum sp. 2E275 TaxID=2980497 RepID=UPI0021D39B55|nr:serine protease [Catenovulum sp. 2E275]MCU4675570.1 serine protease [Catenovulum sp. 2E275]
MQKTPANSRQNIIGNGERITPSIFFNVKKASIYFYFSTTMYQSNYCKESNMIKLVLICFLYLVPFYSLANLVDTIQSIKPAIVGIGTYNALNSPRAQLKGTGFIIHHNLIVTNYHVVSDPLNEIEKERRVIFLGQGNQPKVINFTIAATDPTHDLAILKIEVSLTPQIKPLNLSTKAHKEGTEIAFTGYPLGAVLGLYPVTHRGIISAVTPVVTPAENSSQLSIAALSRLKNPFLTYQLDATAYPGNSGSPVYLQETGEVIAILNKVFVKESKESALTDPSGITYAIPVEYLNSLLKTL